MSRKLVLVGVFLAVLPLVAISAKVRGGEPPKDKTEDSNPFGGGDARPRIAKPTVEEVGPVTAVVSKKPQPSKPARKSKAEMPRLPKLHGGEQAILKALKQETSVEFVETPLKDVVDYLSEKHRIPIRIDGPALKEAGVDESTSVTCNLSGISLRSALEIILDEIQVKWVIHHEVLMITSPTKAESDEYMYTKCYDVSDLVEIGKDHAQQNPLTPFADGQDGSGNAPGCYSSMPGGIGMGGTVAQGFPSRVQMAAQDLQPVKDVITNVVATKTWVENGGTGTLTNHDCLLVISQTREVHMQIEQLLAQLRARRRAVPTLSVELHWLWLDSKHRDRLFAGREKPVPGERSLAVDPQDLRQLAREVPGFHGQVACASGIGTVLSAGDRRSVMTSTIPVVDYAIGYQPVIAMPNVGVAARIRSTCDAGRKTASLDIVSLITRWDASQKPAIIGSAWPAQRLDAGRFPAPTSAPAPGGNPATTAAPPVQVAPVPAARADHEYMVPAGGSATCPVDRTVMPTQQIAATLRVPLGQPVVVGSMTLDPEGSAGLGGAQEDANEVFLVATVSIVREAKR